jgi:hypothetical protein
MAMDRTASIYFSKINLDQNYRADYRRIIFYHKYFRLELDFDTHIISLFYNIYFYMGEYLINYPLSATEVPPPYLTNR